MDITKEKIRGKVSPYTPRLYVFTIPVKTRNKKAVLSNNYSINWY